MSWDGALDDAGDTLLGGTLQYAVHQINYMVATLWGEHRVVGTRSQLPPPLADLDDDDEI